MTLPCLVPTPISCAVAETKVSVPPVELPRIGLVIVPTVPTPGSKAKIVPAVDACPSSGTVDAEVTETLTVNVPDDPPDTETIVRLVPFNAPLAFSVFVIVTN